MLSGEEEALLAECVDDFFLNRGASRADFDEMLHARVEQIASDAARAAERALVERVANVELIHAPRLIHPLREDGSLDESVVLHTYCDECTPDATVSMIEDAEWNGDWPIVEHPCRTVNFLRSALRPEAATTEGAVAEPDAWVDRHGDVWRLGNDGLLWTEETAPFPREHVEKKWGPLRPVADLAARPSSTRGGDQ